jgi:hypothetical protein
MVNRVARGSDMGFMATPPEILLVARDADRDGARTVAQWVRARHPNSASK